MLKSLEILDIRILQPGDKDSVVHFAKQRLAEAVADTMERELQSWSARWRPEALDCYLPMGWSYAAYREDQMQGFLIAQPLLFFRGLTQTLWIEHLLTVDSATGHQLFECVSRWARDKHFQCVLGEDDARMQELTQGPRQILGSRLIEFKTARY